jgi:starvation-inducible DNA-binding protein
MKLEIGISEKNLQKNRTILTVVLANEMLLYVKTRKAHWNVSGSDFMELHKLFEQQYKQIESSIDEVAERIGKLGGNAIGTLKEFEKNATLKESPDTYPESKTLITELLNDHEDIIKLLRTDISDIAEKTKDAGTADFLTKLLEVHETQAWVLRRYLS